MSALLEWAALAVLAAVSAWYTLPRSENRGSIPVEKSPP